MAGMVDVVEFVLGKERYALDIQLAREIVEMIPITPIPRAPAYITGVINLRGEITSILNLNTLLGLSGNDTATARKIIVLVPEAAGGNSAGIIVDDVRNVLQIPESDCEPIGEGFSAEFSSYVKGIIKVKGAEGENNGKGLLIWIDMKSVLANLVRK